MRVLVQDDGYGREEILSTKNKQRTMDPIEVVKHLLTNLVMALLAEKGVTKST